MSESANNDTLERTRQLYTASLHNHKPFHLLHRLFARHIHVRHTQQYKQDGSPVVFVTDNSKGVKTPCFRWSSDDWIDLSTADESPHLGNDPPILVSQNWKKLSWKRVKGIVFYLHGFGSHSRFDLLAFDSKEIAPFLGERKEITDLEQQLLLDVASQEDVQKSFEGSWAERITRAGFVLYAPDLEAHGLAQSATSHRCHIADIDRLIDHQIQWLEKLVKCGEIPSGGVPLFIAGNAMGGAIVLRMLQVGFAQRRLLCDTKSKSHNLPATKPVLRGCLLISPTISAERLSNDRFTSACARWCAGLCSHSTPDQQVITSGRYPYVAELIRNDCLNQKGSLPPRRSRQIFRMARQAKRSFSLVPSGLALFLCHSAFDTFSDPEGAEYYMRHSHSEDKTSIFLDYGWHCLSKEPGFLSTIDLALKWMLERV